MRLPPSIRSSILCSVLFTAVVTHSDAFEQGSYYVIDLVESADAEPVPGRLAVPKSVLAQPRTASTPSVSLEKHGEFEIDYSEGMQQTNDSAFEFSTPAETITEIKSTDFSSGAFDFGGSENDTVFGQ